MFGRCTADPNGGLLRLEIMLLGKEGRRTRAAYLLRQENGQYRVAGVQPGEEDTRAGDNSRRWPLSGAEEVLFPIGGGHFPGGSPFSQRGGHFLRAAVPFPAVATFLAEEVPPPSVLATFQAGRIFSWRSSMVRVGHFVSTTRMIPFGLRASTRTPPPLPLMGFSSR